MNFLLAMFAGLTVAVVVFLLLSTLFVRGFSRRAVGWLLRPLAFGIVVIWGLMMTAAVTQINLATQVYGTLPATSMPSPSATTLGGIESITSASHNWVAYIDTSGVPHQSQPAFTDISGTPSTTQVPVQSLTTTGSSGAATLSAGVLNIPNYGTPTFNQSAPSGSINGSNTSFTLSPTPAASANVNCFLNGLQQQQGSGNDYTISGATITYLTAPPTGSKLICLWY